MITNDRLLISTTFCEEKVTDFAKDVCDCWPKIEKIEELNMPDDGVEMYDKLRKLIPATVGVLKKLLCALFIVSPHSMTVENVISHYNQLKSIHRSSTSDTTFNSRMSIALNGIGRPTILDQQWQNLLKKQKCSDVALLVLLTRLGFVCCQFYNKRSINYMYFIRLWAQSRLYVNKVTFFTSFFYFAIQSKST